MNDVDAALAAVAERQFLAQIDHPNIVKIYNFVTHRRRRLHRDGDGGRRVAERQAQAAPGAGRAA